MEQTIEEKDGQLAAQKEAADNLAGEWPLLCKVFDNQATLWWELLLWRAPVQLQSVWFDLAGLLALP